MRKQGEHCSALRSLTWSCSAIALMVVSCAAGGPDVARTPEGIQPKPLHVPSAQAYEHFLKGALAELANDFPTAIKEYEAGIREDPNSLYLRVRLGKLHFSSGNMTAALQAVDAVDASGIDDESTLLQLAKIYTGAGKPDRAVGVYDHLIALFPKSSQGIFSKGILQLNLQRVNEAQATLEQGLALFPTSHVGHFYLAKTFQQMGKLAEAKTHFEKVLELFPQFEPGYQALAGLLEEQRDLQGAVRLYQRYLSQVNPHKKQYRNEIVRLLLSDKSYEAALEHLQRMVADDPLDLHSQIRIGLVYAEMGRHAQAIEQLAVIVEAHPDELRVRDYLGLMYEEIQDYDRAIQAYEANLQRDPSFFDSRMHLGYLAYKLKRYGEAIRHLRQAVELNPGSPESHLLLGLAYVQSEQFEAATSVFEHGLTLHPKHADLRFNLGAAYDKLHRFPDVVREMEMVLSIEPDHADALNYLGYTYADRDIHIEKAVELTKRAVALKPQNGYYVDSLGWALFKMGRVQEALRELQRAVALVKDDPVIFEHLGAIYLFQHARDQAKAAWQRSLELDPTNVELQKKFDQEGFGVTPPPAGMAHDQPQMSQFTIENAPR